MNPSIIYRRFDGIYRSGPTLHLRIINSLPAMLYHGVPRRRVPPELLSEGASFRAKAGVNTEPAVLMRVNYRNPQGQREMLWPQDLDEIALNGRTANGCRIAGSIGDNA